MVYKFREYDVPEARLNAQYGPVLRKGKVALGTFILTKLIET